MATVSHPAALRRRISIGGMQGVGFRPYLCNLAQRIGIRGFVLNSSSGATIEAEGSDTSLEPSSGDAYHFEVDSGEPAQIDLRSAIREVGDQMNGQKTSVIASCINNTIAAVIAEVCSRIRKDEQLDRVWLSGSTFQNMYLLERSVARLRRLGFDVLLHSKVPPNHGGISLGQAVIANQILRTGA